MIDWDNIELPNGMSKDEMIEEILTISKIKAAQHSRQNKAMFLSQEDLEQEIAIKCISALPRFDASKSFGDRYKLFFYRCADNVVIDLKRRHVCYHKVPCKKCPEFDKKAKNKGCHDCKKYKNKSDCKLWARYQNLNESKFALGTMMGTYGSSEQYTGDSLSTSKTYRERGRSDGGTPGSKNLTQFELDDSIMLSVGSKVFEIYEKLVENNFNMKKLTPSEAKMIKSAMNRIYRGEE
jgi:hypothetical protein